MDNIFVREGNQPGLREEILDLESKNGLPLVRFNGYYLNSQYNPQKEAEILADKYYKKNHAHVLFGLGYGYLAKALLEKMGENDFLLIIEPSFKLFKKVKAEIDLGRLVNHKKVFFIVGYESSLIEEEIQYIINNQYVAQVEIIISPNYQNIFPSYVNNLMELVKQNVILSVVNINTIAAFSTIWQKNLLNNLIVSWKSLPFQVFKNKFVCPVIIAASGPSLSKQLETLKKVRKDESALIIAAGSTINPLLKAGIKPHLVVSIDGGEANWNHFKKIKYDDIPLFYSLAVHKDIPKNHTGFKVAFNTGDQALSSWVNKVVGEDLGFVAGGASVATFSLYIAKMISSGPITLIGQDLAYTNNNTHAKGNLNYKNISEEEFQDKKKYVTIKGYYGEEVVSDYQFLSMKRVIEDMVFAFRKYGDDRPFYNSTEGGANINGLENLNFNEFIQTYCNTGYYDEFIDAFKPYNPNYKQKAQIYNLLEAEKVNLQKAIPILKSAIELIEHTSKDFGRVDKKVLNALDQLDKELNPYLESNIVHYLIMLVNFRVDHKYQEKLNETTLEQTKRILDKSGALYRGVLDAVEITMTILDKILEEV